MIRLLNIKTGERRYFSFVHQETNRIVWTARGSTFQQLPAKYIGHDEDELVDFYELYEEWWIEKSSSESGKEIIRKKGC
jgi:hypothetical protein